MDVPVKYLQLVRLDDGRQELRITFDDEHQTSLAWRGHLVANLVLHRERPLTFDLSMVARTDLSARVWGEHWGSISFDPPPTREEPLFGGPSWR